MTVSFFYFIVYSIILIIITLFIFSLINRKKVDSLVDSFEYHYHFGIKNNDFLYSIRYLHSIITLQDFFRIDSSKHEYYLACIYFDLKDYESSFEYFKNSWIKFCQNKKFELEIHSKYMAILSMLFFNSKEEETSRQISFFISNLEKGIYSDINIFSLPHRNLSYETSLRMIRFLISEDIKEIEDDFNWFLDSGLSFYFIKEIYNEKDLLKKNIFKESAIQKIKQEIENWVNPLLKNKLESIKDQESVLNLPKFQMEEFTNEDKITSLDKLFKTSLDYHNSENYKKSLEFVAKLKYLAPFNAWLLKEQNKDIDYVATAKYWKEKFNRDVKRNARAYVIMKPFSPVEFVYDVNDTYGDPLPNDIKDFFVANGKIESNLIENLIKCCEKKDIKIEFREDLFKKEAGWVSHDELDNSKKIVINKNYSNEVQFSTFCHELAHLMLGHLGKFLNCQCEERSHLSKDIKEIEAETVSWLICERLNIKTNSDSYLFSYLQNNQKLLKEISIELILTTVGKIENIILKNECNVKKSSKSL